MIRDAYLQFSGYNALAGTQGDSITTAATAAPSTNVIDLANVSGLPASASSPAVPGRDMGIGDDPSIKIRATVNGPGTTSGSAGFTGGTSIQVLFQGAPDNGSGAPGTYVTYASGPVVLTAKLVVGAALLDIDLPRPAPGEVPPRFIRLAYTSVGTFTAGTLVGELVIDRFDQITQAAGVLSAYPAGINIAN